MEPYAARFARHTDAAGNRSSNSGCDDGSNRNSHHSGHTGNRHGRDTASMRATQTRASAFLPFPASTQDWYAAPAPTVVVAELIPAPTLTFRLGVTRADRPTATA